MTNLTSSKEFGEIIRKTRLEQELTQIQLAAYCGVGKRFIVDLEKGKETCALNKSLRVAHMLGLKITAFNK